MVFNICGDIVKKFIRISNQSVLTRYVHFLHNVEQQLQGRQFGSLTYLSRMKLVIPILIFYKRNKKTKMSELHMYNSLKAAITLLYY